jgi:hypothetical protein
LLWAVGLVSACSGLAGLWWTVREVRRNKLDLDALAGLFSLGLSALGLIVGAASLAVSWLGFRADRREHTGDVPVGGVADSLAIALRGQWEAEARLRRLNDPYPLPVSWRPAGRNLVEPWPLLLQLAARHGRQDGWAERPEELAGADTEITDVFTARAPGRRLLVLGEPGAGKTMLLVVLLLGLLDRRSPGDPVPVIFPLASWNPRHQDLDSWMGDRLTADYPALHQHAAELRAGMQPLWAAYARRRRHADGASARIEGRLDFNLQGVCKGSLTAWVEAGGLVPRRVRIQRRWSSRAAASPMRCGRPKVHDLPTADLAGQCRPTPVPLCQGPSTRRGVAKCGGERSHRD